MGDNMLNTKREAIEFLNGMRDQFVDQKKLKTNSDLKVISAIGLVCGMAEESLLQQITIESLKCCSNCKHSRSMMGDCDIPIENDSDCSNSNPIDWETRELSNT
jgi:hypothetical protein